MEQQNIQRLLLDLRWVTKHSPSLLIDGQFNRLSWAEIEFKWMDEEDADNEPRYIHFKHENFRGIFLPEAKNGNGFGVVKMVPMSRLFFFFTIGGEQRVSKKYPVLEVHVNNITVTLSPFSLGLTSFEELRVSSRK